MQAFILCLSILSNFFPLLRLKVPHVTLYMECNLIYAFSPLFSLVSLLFHLYHIQSIHTQRGFSFEILLHSWNYEQLLDLLQFYFIIVSHFSRSHESRVWNSLYVFNSSSEMTERAQKHNEIIFRFFDNFFHRAKISFLYIHRE